MQMTCGRPEMNALAAIVFALRGLDPAQFGPSALHNHRPMSLNQLWRHPGLPSQRVANSIWERGNGFFFAEFHGQRDKRVIVKVMVKILTASWL
jgi:hypothetical protein